MRLIGTFPPNSISHFYQVISKKIEKAMNPDLYNTLILRHQDEVNKQEHIVLMDIGVEFFLKHKLTSPSIFQPQCQPQSGKFSMERERF